ncbi:MAG: hypothetical protein SO434_02630 [Eubacteriales bacterium]|nr:hypothetical protein [Eubacteriales bacterium]
MQYLASPLKAVESIGNIFFYILLAVLVAVVVIICVLFTKSNRFKVKMRESIIEKNPEYEPPRIVKIYDEKIEDNLGDADSTDKQE